MRRKATGRPASVIGLVLTALLAVPHVGAIPIDRPGASAAPLAVPRAAASTGPVVAALQGSRSDPALPVPAHEGAPPGTRLPAADEPLPGAPGRVATLSAPVVAVEEDPKVELGDVVRSVLRSTADAVPWLHLAPSQAADRRGARLAAERELRLDNTLRFDDASSPPADASAHGAGPGSNGDNAALPLLSREMVQFARELIDNPLAWMIGFLALLSGVTLSLVRGRDRTSA